MNKRLYLIIFALLFSALCGSYSSILAADTNLQIKNLMPVCPAPTFFQVRRHYIDYGAFPGYITVGDLNNDNRKDLISGEPLTGGLTTLTVMLGVGNFGGFAQETNYPAGGGPRSLTTADVNNDGKLDVLVTQPSGIDIYLGNGDGTLQLPVIYYEPQPLTSRLADNIAKDFNGDGNIDLAISTTDYYPSRLFIRFGNGNGTFNNTQTLSADNVNFRTMFDGDINNDGKTDLITVSGDDSVSRIFLGNSDGTFAQAVVGPNIPSHEIQLLDANNDGFRDIYTVGTSVRIFYNNGQGGFSAPQVIPLNLPQGSTVSSGKVADFNGDGILDAAFITGNIIRVYQGTSLTNFEPLLSTVLLYDAITLRLGDFNNDSMPDFVVAGYDSSSLFSFINKCGNTQPHFSIGGGLFNYEGFSINNALVTINSEAVGSISAVAQNQSFFFNDLPGGQSYTVTPTHSLFNFLPPSRTITNLDSNLGIDFEGKIKKFRIYGGIIEAGTNGLPAANVPMRLTGVFNTDIRTTTNALGEYTFSDLYPASQVQSYIIQFEQNPIYYSPQPYYIHQLTSDLILNFSVARRLYSVTFQLTTPNGQPRSQIYLVHNETNNFVQTNAAGIGVFTNRKAGLRHTFYAAAPSLRFTPEQSIIPYLSGDTEINMRVARRNRSDFDNDGKSDLAVWRPSSGTWYVRQSSDNQFWGNTFGISTDIPAAGDFDGDQKADIVVFRPSDGTWHIILSTNGSYRVQAFGTNGDVPVPADFDRDGKTDVAVFRPSNGVWYVYQSYYQNVTANYWGTQGDQPLVGDFDGDTYNDRVVFRPSTGVWYINQSSDNGFRAIPFGLGSDKVLTGDFDGDTKNDLAVWRPETGIWYILKSSDNSFGIQAFGTNGDVPLSGDFDGDGIDDIAVYRPSTGIWYVLKSSDGGYLINYFGLNGDIPVPAMMVR